MGWAHKKGSDCFLLREAITKELDFDILGISETHLLSSKGLSVDGFTWFGNNRKDYIKEQKKGLEEWAF